MAVLHPTTSAEFDAILHSSTYLFVDFFATWCPPCKAISPTIERLAVEHSIPNLLAFVKVDVDELQDISQRYGISAMPTFLFFKEGERVAVNGDSEIKGAIPPKVTLAAQKLGGLAKARAEAVQRECT